MATPHIRKIKDDLVCQIDLAFTTILAKFATFREAGKKFPEVKNAAHCISICANGKIKTSRGFIWRLESQINDLNLKDISDYKCPEKYPGGVKECIVCKLQKPLDQFYCPNGVWSSQCKLCLAERSKRYRSTMEGTLASLVCNSRASSKQRGEKGRIEASRHEITKDDLLDIYNRQDGLCYYSGIPLQTKNNTDWKCSPERLDNEKGYLRDNVVLCCLEFNSTAGWSLEKINQVISLRNTLMDENKLLELVLKARTKPIPRGTFRGKHAESALFDGVKKFKCTFCDIFKEVKDYYEYTRGTKCKVCVGKYRKRDLRDYLHRMLSVMKWDAKDRGLKRDDESWMMDFTIDDLADKIIEQKGRCFYSGIPLVFEQKADWRCSPERLDNTKGYTKENVVLICYEFNVGWTIQWSREKFNFFLSHLIQQKNTAVPPVAPECEADIVTERKIPDPQILISPTLPHQKVPELPSVPVPQVFPAISQTPIVPDIACIPPVLRIVSQMI